MPTTHALGKNHLLSDYELLFNAPRAHHAARISKNDSQWFLRTIPQAYVYIHTPSLDGYGQIKGTDGCNINGEEKCINGGICRKCGISEQNPNGTNTAACCR